MATTRAKEACVLVIDGMPFPIQKEQAYDTKDDIVRSHPWLFELDNVEQATAAPGERRNARRPE